MGISFLSDFHLSNGVFPIFCYEISATALAGRFCVARGTRDTKIQVIEVSVSSLYISSLWLYRVYKKKGNRTSARYYT